jgi:LmbE family N-acetylglucosaminyl deacetylase
VAALVTAVLVATAAPAPAVPEPARTTLSFVAHQDDDLLFMNPDLAASLHAGNRVVTVVVTAGTPFDPARLTERELGLLNAYAFMAGPEHAVTDPADAPALLARWRLHGGQPIAVADAAGGTRHAIQYDFTPPLPAGGALSLVFLRVVEENGVDLAALLRGEVAEIPTVACEAGCLLGASLAAQAYGREQLVDTLEALIARFADRALPGGLAVSTLDATKLFHRQVAYGLGWVDHADHLAVAELAVAAFLRHHRRPHATPRTLHQYRAYNTGREPPNLGEPDGEPREKRRAFYRYFALGEGLAGQDDDGRPREYTNRDPDDPHFHITTYEAWSERRYVLSSLPPVQGRLAAGEPPRCLHASGDAAALGPCDGAPAWEAAGGALRLLPDGAACLALDGDLARVAPCAPAVPADGEARAFVPTGTGQIRTRGGGCLQAGAATDAVASADCAKHVDGDGDPTRRPIAAQAWSWLPP